MSCKITLKIIVLQRYDNYSSFVWLTVCIDLQQQEKTVVSLWRRRTCIYPTLCADVHSVIVCQLRVLPLNRWPSPRCFCCLCCYLFRGHFTSGLGCCREFRAAFDTNDSFREGFHTQNQEDHWFLWHVRPWKIENCSQSYTYMIVALYFAFIRMSFYAKYEHTFTAITGSLEISQTFLHRWQILVSKEICQGGQKNSLNKRYYLKNSSSY